MPLRMEVGLSPGDFVLDGDPAPLPKRGAAGRSPKFSAHVYCDQTAGWIKMVLIGTEIGFSPGDFVLNGVGLSSPPQKKGGSPSPIFSPFLLWPNGRMHQDATRYGGRPQPRELYIR